MLQMNIYEEFAAWLDNLLENNNMPDNAVAYCFNLYEESDEEHLYSVQLIAASEFDPADEQGEWACEEVWSSEEDVFVVDTSDEKDTGWNHAQELFREMIEEYLVSGGYRSVFDNVKGIAVGFVDGELEIVKK
ncbi:MAG: hypothetical protein J6Y71_03050 [Ruminococcus sp.]|nr:hypothetical protein [Ruminococcus sp.]